MTIFVFFIKTSVLACSTSTQAMWYMQIAELIACIIFLYENICLSYQTSLLACKQLFPNLGVGVIIAFYG
jgi:hypothetical protein